MKENLFDHIDIDPKNCHIPNGELPKDEMKSFCAEYEQAIADAGGIDLQILGIGSNGHIGFNEPGSSRFSKTRVTPLENSTRLSNAGDFESVTQVPRLIGYHGHQYDSQKQKNNPDGLGKQQSTGRSEIP